MRIPYFELDDRAFERLVVSICGELLGPGIQPFSDGADGGRDARFDGRAQCFPSVADPINGKVIVQAKHTQRPFAKFSDSDFDGESASSILSLELPRIRALVEAEELEHYLLFANRRLSGNAEASQRRRITSEGVSSVHLFGEERINLVLSNYSHLVDRFELADLAGPPFVDPQDLAEVILAFVEHCGTIRDEANNVDTLVRQSFDLKNTTNGLSESFAKYITSRYLPSFVVVKDFLAHPDNCDIQSRYDAAAAEIHEQLILNRDRLPFDEFLTRTLKLLFDRDGDLARNKKITRLVFFYMYWNCDFGKETSSASTN